MAETADFKCLRCGYAYKDSFVPGVVTERTCPKCRSNSVRRLKAPVIEKKSGVAETKSPNEIG